MPGITFWKRIIFIVCLLSCPALMAGERFTDNNDGTVTDHQMGIMWAKTDNQGDINWHQANKWVRYTFPDTIGGRYDNWRLPTLRELKSLYIKDKTYEGYEADCGQQVRIVPEIALTCGWVWTSESKTITATVFNFNRGYHYTDRMVHHRAYRVLPVRTINDK